MMNHVSEVQVICYGILHKRIKTRLCIIIYLKEYFSSYNNFNIIATIHSSKLITAILIRKRN